MSNVLFSIFPNERFVDLGLYQYAGKHDNLLVKMLSAPGLWMQRITTQEPTDDIIEVGIASLEAVITDNPEDDEIK